MISQNTCVPSQHDPENVERLIAGRYRLRSPLGHGSMGTVWAAFDEFLRRPVAVKEVRLPPGLPAGEAEQLRERALREARAIASLSHPNVITLHDVVREDGAPFVVMELFPGRSLTGLLRRYGPLSIGQAATIGDALAAALEAAHAAGITHRDVKPGNVLVAEDGRVKLTDFGIARNVSEVTMTSTGIMLGSPAFMAPEVASGKRVSPAADMWGLGATLYAATEGEPPYDAEGDPLATAQAVVHEEVPQPGPGPLAEIISALMTKDPDARPLPADVRRFLHDLRAEPGPLFPAELFADLAPTPGEKPDDSRTDELESAEEGNPAEETGASEQTDRAEGPAPLAADPGPLPFALSESSESPTVERPSLRRRSPAVTVVLVVVSVLLFAGAAVGGFAAARVLAGEPVLPPKPPASFTRIPTTAQEKVITRTAEASMLADEPRTTFTIDVPADWSKFVTQQASKRLPSSTLIEFVSPDGAQVLTVERFADFFAPPFNGTTKHYAAALTEAWPKGDWVLVEHDQRKDAELLVYRTVDSATPSPSGDRPSSKISRTTFAELHQVDSSLWVVSVTVPTEQERAGRARLFERLVPTFTVQ